MTSIGSIGQFQRNLTLIQREANRYRETEPRNRFNGLIAQRYRRVYIFQVDQQGHTTIIVQRYDSFKKRRSSPRGLSLTPSHENLVFNFSNPPSQTDENFKEFRTALAVLAPLFKVKQQSAFFSH